MNEQPELDGDWRKELDGLKQRWGIAEDNDDGPLMCAVRFLLLAEEGVLYRKEERGYRQLLLESDTRPGGE